VAIGCERSAALAKPMNIALIGRIAADSIDKQSLMPYAARYW
jgi:hypothetical protein